MIFGELGLQSDGMLVIPRGTAGLKNLSIDMKEILAAEKRIQELHRSTPMTMGSLITDFNVAIMRANRIIGIVQMEMREAKRTLEMEEAIFKIEKAEEFLRVKGIKSSVDARDSACTLDPAVQAARNRYDVLFTTSEYLQGVKEGLVLAYHGAKKVCDVYMSNPDNRNYGG